MMKLSFYASQESSYNKLFTFKIQSWTNARNLLNLFIQKKAIIHKAYITIYVNDKSFNMPLNLRWFFMSGVLMPYIKDLKKITYV